MSTYAPFAKPLYVMLMPGEQNLGHGLRVDVLLDELFQQFLAHHMLGVVSI